MIAALFKASVLAPRAVPPRVPYALADRSRTYDPRARESYFPLPGLSALYWCRYLATVRSARLLIVQSKQDVDAYIRLNPELAGRVVAVPNGVDAARFDLGDSGREIARTQMRARWGIATGAFVVGCVARLQREKRPEILVDLATALGPSCVVVVVGDGPEAYRLRDCPGLVVEPSLPREQIASALSAFDLFVLPSVSDAFPNAVLEAMAAGLPIVASMAGGCAEIVLHGVTGLLLGPVAPSGAWISAVKSYVDAPETCRRHGAAGRDRARVEYTPGRFIAGWRDGLLRALSTSG